jgi:large subunit ribosomal protein L17
MRHHDKNRKFGRPTKQRRAMLSALARSLVLHERIETTEARAKELRPFIEKLVTKGTKQTLASRRLLAARLGDDVAAKKMTEDIAPRFADRAGGYTRIVKRGPGGGDAGERATIEFVA